MPDLGRLTTHVLDTANGKPAVGMSIEFSVRNGEGWKLIKTITTNADGRTDEPLPYTFEWRGVVAAFVVAATGVVIARVSGMPLAPRFLNWHFVIAAMVYPLWGLLQQYIFQFYLFGRLLQVVSLRIAIPILGCAFAAVHFPRWPVMLATLVAGAKHQRDFTLREKQLDEAQKALDEYLDRKEQMRRMLLDLEAEADKGVFISEEAMNAWVDSWDTDNESPPPKPDISPARYSRRK